MKIKKLNENAKIPLYMTAGSAGFDLTAAIDCDIVIEPMQRALIPTGLAIALNEGFELQIRPRSGLAIKNGITVLNSPGTIDSDYRGEIKVILINLSDEQFIVHNGDRIAQAVCNSYITVRFDEVEDLDETKRGSGGFGSTSI